MRIVIVEDSNPEFKFLSAALNTTIPGVEISRAESLRGASLLADSIKEKCIWIVDGNFPTFDCEPGSIGINGPEVVRIIQYSRNMNELIIGHTSDPTIFEEMEDESKPKHIVEKDKIKGIQAIIGIIKDH